MSKQWITKISIANTNKPSSFKGKTHSLQSRQKITNSLLGKTGELSRNWQGGLSRLGYPYYFNTNLKQEIRERDNFTCECCGLKEKDHFRGNKSIKLMVHHIDYNKQNCNKDNLITLCNSCNIRANYDKDYWFAFYTYKMEEIKWL